MRNHTLSLAEQFRKDARIFHRHRVLEVRDEELDVERAFRLHDAALLDHAAHPESLALPGFARRDLRGIAEAHHVVSARLHGKSRRDPDANNDPGDERHPFLPRSHFDISMRRRASCLALDSEFSASTRLSTTIPKPSTNAGQRYLP